MRILPGHLIRSILLLSLAQAQEDHTDGQLSLWDVGFSIQRQWGLVYEDQQASDSACPVPASDPPPVSDPEPEPENVAPPEIPVTEGDDLVSFEEWKRIKQADAADELIFPEGEPSSATSSTVDPPSKETDKPPEALIEEPKKSGHHKFNYASPDCSARIHSASPQTQHASSVLHKSRDRYMLTPCKSDQHWVVIELCDEIRIEAVEVAVWEFFSSVVREVRVSIDEDGDTEQWKEVASFVGKNVRGVQTFTLPEATSFHRFIRLDFPSHYGSEYYCPVSLVKVFGMNQMEAFKWEQKRIASSQKEREKEQLAEMEERRAKEEERKQQLSRNRREEEAARERELSELERLVHREAVRARYAVDIKETSEAMTATTATIAPLPTASVLSTSSGDQNTTTIMSSEILSSEAENKTADGAGSETASSAKPTTRSEQSESIYVSITRRLAALEGNSSLIARYIEEQSRVIRAALSALEKDWDEWRLNRDTEDRNRWAEDRMRQEDRLGKFASQLEMQRALLEADHKSTAAQLRALADELSYERRRGLAQMGIMIVVIALGLVSQSSAFESLLHPLVAEVKRRRSIRHRDGPLTGLRIDMGADRPPAVIGHGPPEPTSPTPRSRPKPSLGLRRPGTPNKRRQLSLIATPYRSFSTSDYPHSALRSRSSAHRRLARNSHLHPLEPDRRHHSDENTSNGAPDVEWSDTYV